MIVEIGQDFLNDLKIGIDTSLRPLTGGQMLWLEIQSENYCEEEEINHD